MVGTLSYTDRQILSLLVEPLRRDLGLSDVQMGLLQGLAFALIYSVAGIPLGRLADKWSRRSILMAGVLIWSLATVGCGLASGFWALFLARVLVGVGEATLAPAAISMIGDLFPPHRRGIAVSIFMMGLCVGAGVALGAGGALLQSAEHGTFSILPIVGGFRPWRIVLLALALPGALVIMLLATMREPARRGSLEDAAMVTSTFDALRVLARHGRVVGPMWGAMAFMSAGDFSLLNWTPALLERVYHQSASSVGSTLGLSAVLGGVFGTLMSGLLSDRMARTRGHQYRSYISAVLAVLSSGAAAIAIERGGAALVLGCFTLWTMMSWGAQSAGIAAMQEAIPNEVRGMSIACMAFFNMIFGLTFGTLITAALTEHVFHDPLALGRSLAIVVAPSALAAAALYFWSARAIAAQPAVGFR